jgi:CRP-like cAMP-binding protein
MESNKLLEAFGDMARLPADAMELFMSIVERKECLKKQLLQEAGCHANHVYFIEKGIARTFYYRDGKDITYWIAAENEFAGAMASFFNRTISNKNVELLEDSIVWEFSHAKLESLYSESKEIERMGRLFAQYGIGLVEQRFDDLLFLTARERYDILLQKHPGILQRVSLGIIASYLGITRETLSRIRSKN